MIEVSVEVNVVVVSDVKVIIIIIIIIILIIIILIMILIIIIMIIITFIKHSLLLPEQPQRHCTKQLKGRIHQGMTIIKQLCSQRAW